MYGYCTMLGIGYQFEPRLCSSNRKVTFFLSLSVSLSLSPLAFSTRNSALARIFSPLLFIHQRFIAVFTRGVSRPRVEKKKKKKKGLISDGYKAAPFLAGFGNMTNRAPVTQQKLPLQVRSEKRSIPEFLHVAALSLFPSTSNLGVAGTGAGRISKFRMYSRNKGRCLFSSLRVDNRGYARLLPLPCVQNYHCRVRYYRIHRERWHLSTRSMYVFPPLTRLFVVCAQGRGEAKDQTSSLAGRKDERREGRKKRASGKESVCIIDGRKAARRRVLVR